MSKKYLYIIIVTFVIVVLIILGGFCYNNIKSTYEGRVIRNRINQREKIIFQLERFNYFLQNEAWNVNTSCNSLVRNRCLTPLDKTSEKHTSQVKKCQESILKMDNMEKTLFSLSQKEKDNPYRFIKKFPRSFNAEVELKNLELYTWVCVKKMRELKWIAVDSDMVKTSEDPELFTWEFVPRIKNPESITLDNYRFDCIDMGYYYKGVEAGFWRALEQIEDMQAYASIRSNTLDNHLKDLWH